ncbi:hypothetical protein L7F22_062441 [Adiantum nelumboides]|nr:hypothetical protein [Adiantum nelumboides]
MFSLTNMKNNIGDGERTARHGKGARKGHRFHDMVLCMYMLEGGVILQAFAESGILMQFKLLNVRKRRQLRVADKVVELWRARIARLLRCYFAEQGSSVSSLSPSPGEREEVFFDGGPHIGDLLANLLFGLTLLWLPLTLASVFRCLFLRYRFTNLRVTVMSGLTGSDRKDFSYKVIKDVKYVPRFIGEWGDVVITLTDGTQVELKSVPRFREIAQYCLDRAGKDQVGRPTVGKGLARLATLLENFQSDCFFHDLASGRFCIVLVFAKWLQCYKGIYNLHQA